MPLPCLKPRRSSKVCPAPNSSLDVDLVEVRKGRMLRIQHINPRLRNKQLPQTKHGKKHPPMAPPLELHVPRVSFYGNKCVVTDTPTSNHVKNGANGPSPNSNPAGSGQVTGTNSNVGRCLKSNSFPSNLSKEQKRMLFKMGVRSVSALKNIVLFFFHGVGGSSDIWQTQINYFSSLGFEIVAPDLIGHGMSEVPLKKRAYHFREILADVVAIFDRYCKKKNLIIGHSYGCAFTTVLARERARRVWRLIMISGGGPIPLAPEIGIFAFPLWFVSCIRPCLDQVFEKSAFKKKQKNEMLKRASFNIPSFVLHYVVNGQDWPEGDEVYHSWISVPTLLINGREDTFATLEDAKLMKATIHGSKLEIVDEASHMVMLEAPDKVNKLILDFICSRGSHKLPDVKESAEEGQESPLKITSASSHGSACSGSDKVIQPHYAYQHQHQSRLHDEQLRTPTQSPRQNIVGSRSRISPYSKVPVPVPVQVPVVEETSEHIEEQGVEQYVQEIYGEESVAQSNLEAWENWSKYPQRSSYDNACYESDESGEEYYYYKDQYGNHHYVSSKEYARQFPCSQLPPDNYRAKEMEMSTVEIPAFEDIASSIGMQVSSNEEISVSENATADSYSMAINAQYPVELDPEGSPDRYTVSPEKRLSEHDLPEMTETSESPYRTRETYVNNTGEKPPLRFSVPELQFCEECIQKNYSDGETTDCEKCININLAAAEYRSHQNSSTRRQSVTLALGRQRSDSLDYLGQEQLIIITCYDAEEEEISISSSPTDDTHENIGRLAKEQQLNQSAARHGQFHGSREGEEVKSKKPSLPTLDELEEEYSPGNSPVESLRDNGHEVLPKEEIVKNLHQELLAKVKKRNKASENHKRSKKQKTTATQPVKQQPTFDKNSSPRSSFLESKKLMEAHFSKAALKMPKLPSNGRGSPIESPLKRGPPKAAKPQRPSYSPSEVREEHQDEKVISSSPSFLQSKRAIQEHFSKVGLSSPMMRPVSSPNLTGYGKREDIRTISPLMDRKLSNSSPSALAKTPEEKLASSPKKLEENPEKLEESPVSLRLSVSEWAEKHIMLIRGLASPEKSKVSVETSESTNAQSPLSTFESQSSSPDPVPLSLGEWAENHTKRISEFISPTSSPHKLKGNVSGEVSQLKNQVSKEESENESSLSLIEWSNRHLKIVASRLSFSGPSLEKDQHEVLNSAEQEEGNSGETLSLSVVDWAQRHVQKIEEMKKSGQNEDEILKSDTKSEHTTSDNKEIVSSPKREMNSLSLSEWAERHVRKIEETNSKSPKYLKRKLSESEPLPVRRSGSGRTQDRVKKPVGSISTSALNEWAEKHVRRIAEQKLVIGSIKEATEIENDNIEIKEKEKTAEISVSGKEHTASSKEIKDSPADNNKNNVLTDVPTQAQPVSILANDSLGVENKSPLSYSKDTDNIKKTEVNCSLSANTLEEPRIPKTLKSSYETSIVNDTSLSGDNIVGTRDNVRGMPLNVNPPVVSDVNRETYVFSASNQIETTQETNSCHQTSLFQNQPKSEDFVSMPKLNVPGLKEFTTFTLEKNTNKEKNSDSTLSKSTMSDETNSFHQASHFDEPPERGDCVSERLQKVSRVTVNITSVSTAEKSEEYSSSPKARTVQVSQATKELESSQQDVLSKISSLPSKTDLPSNLESLNESTPKNLSNSPTSTDLLRSISYRRRSSLLHPRDLEPQATVSTSRDLEFLTNSPSNKNNNNNSINNNNHISEFKEGFSNLSPTKATFDDNSNVVASPSFASKEKDFSRDKSRTSSDDQESHNEQSAEKGESIDNGNNRIIPPILTTIITTNTDTPTCSNVSNANTYTTTTNIN